MNTNSNFGKLIDGELEYAPIPLDVYGRKYWTNSPAIHSTVGYKRIIDCPCPNEPNTTYTYEWVESTDAISRVWTGTETTPTGESVHDMLARLDEESSSQQDDIFNIYDALDFIFNE